MKTKEEIKQEMDKAEQELKELLAERDWIMKKYKFNSKQGRNPDGIHAWNELSPKLNKAYNKLNHLTQLYLGVKD